MKKFPSIKIVWNNSPTKGIVIQRNIGDAIYERKVKPSGLLSSTEACKLLKITLVYLYRLVGEGKLKAVRKSGKLYFKLKDLLRLKLKRKRL